MEVKKLKKRIKVIEWGDRPAEFELKVNDFLETIDNLNLIDIKYTIIESRDRVYYQAYVLYEEA